MFGSHLSIAGGLENALLEAEALKMDCVQIFTKNQRQWKVVPLSERQIQTWHQQLRRSPIRTVVSHDSYLINLASPDTAMRKKSIDLFSHELLRCQALGIGYLVTHPGAHMNAGEQAGLCRVARAIDQLYSKMPGLTVMTCLEVTAGQGTSLGYRLEHLQSIIDMVKYPQHLGVCLDTAHLLAAGYDLTCRRGCQQTVREVDRVIGLDSVKVIHVNDSQVPRSKRVDRHAHIGHGHVSLEAFEVLVNHRKFKSVPKILETPKEETPDGRQWDLVNLDTLRGLVRVRPQTKKKKSRTPPARGA